MIRKLILTFCYCALALGAFAQDASDSDAYFRYIQRHGQSPIEYILDKIRAHSAVILGEDHWIDAHPLFLCDLVAAAERDSTTHIDALAVEFGNERDQALADSLMASPVYREDLVFEILRHTPDDLGNPYKEYADVFYATWKANQSHPADGRPYRKSHLLKDQCDGIVFIKPVEEFNGARLIDIYDEAFLQTVSKRTKGKCQTAADALRQVKEWHPILQDPVNK